MILEISITIAYLVYIFITNLQMKLPMVMIMEKIIDIPMIIQTLVLNIVFFGIKEVREIYINERITGRILFLIVAALVSILNAMIYVGENADMSTYIMFYSLPINNLWVSTFGIIYFDSSRPINLLDDIGAFPF